MIDLKRLLKDFTTSIGSTQVKWEANYLEEFINSYCDENKLKFHIGLPLKNNNNWINVISEHSAYNGNIGAGRNS